GSTRRSLKPTFVSLVAGYSVESVKLLVYARSSDDISSALVEIERFIQNHITSKKVEHEKLFDVVLKHWDELKSLAKDGNLRITCVNETTVSIEGLLSKVLEAKDKLTEMVSRHTDEERRLHQLSYISQNVQWYYSDHSCRSREVVYSAQLNGTIEVACMNGEAMVEITESDGQQYNVDFAQMVARNKSTGQTRKLSRKLIGSATGLELPSNWTHQPVNQVVELVRLTPSSPEYSEVRSHFVAGGGRANQLYSVERIQNPQLYSMYLAFKKSMAMRGQVNEMRLFHGTDAANIHSINTNNFSRSFAGANGTSYGNGVYFARDASYSIKFTKPQHFGTRRKMYMAKVLVGEYTKGVSGMKAPPTKSDPNNPGLRYDSVVNDIRNPRMYIIFQDNQYYPEYLLTLQ
ncbi:poly [ADP-ribose] polymerase 14-like, partial [Paramuricea clavata]